MITMIRRSLGVVLMCLVVVLPAAVEAGERVTLGWDRSADGAVAGYRLFYGTSPTLYVHEIDVGNEIEYQLPLLPDGTYYVAVQAYAAGGQTSPLSLELAVTIAPGAVSIRERSRADFNGDGNYDILWRNRTTGQLAAWMLNDATVKVEAGLSHSMPDLNWRVAGTGDFNGDGQPDILWRHELYGFLGAWFMNGLNTVGVVSLSTPRVEDTAWKIVGVGDITGDGKPDIVWQHDTGPLALWRMHGTTNMAGSALHGHTAMVSDPRWRVVGVADMNGDGQMDLLWHHSNGWVATWLMSGGNVFGVESLNPVAEFDANWQIVGTADLNRDGHQDILWQHATDGMVLVWYMDGITRVQTAVIGYGSLGGPDWKVVGPK